MKFVKTIELKLAKVSKDLPALPEGGKKWLAEYAWALALAGAILGGLLALFLMTGVLFVSSVTIEYPSNIYTVDVAREVRHSIAMAWVALAALIVYVVILAKAVPKLKLKSKSGWDLLFLGVLLFLVYDIFYWLQYPSAVSSFIWNLISTAVSLYLLFQIRDKFTKPTS